MPDDRNLLDMLVVPQVNRRTFARLVANTPRGIPKGYPRLIYACQGQTSPSPRLSGLVAVWWTGRSCRPAVHRGAVGAEVAFFPPD